MSERPTTEPDDFDALEESKKRADTGKQIYESFMERDAEEDLSPEKHTEAYQQMADYLQSRPYKDRNGRLHDPITGGFISEEEAGVFYTSASIDKKDGEEVDEYDSMSLSALAALSAEAEFHNDRTTMLSVDDAIQEKIIGMDLKDELIERDGSERDNSERSMVLEHVMKLRQKYLDKLKQDAEDQGIDDDIKQATERVLGNDNNGEDTGTEEPSSPEETPEDTGTEEPSSPEETPEDTGTSFEISDTAREALESSRDRYATLSSKRRGETLNASKEELEQAKKDYEIALLEINNQTYEGLVEYGMSPEEAKAMILESSLVENQKLMQSIADKRIEASANKRLAKFYNWFGKQQGFKGRLKKMAAITAVTLPLGVVAGAAGVALLGPVTGALIGGAMARGIARGLAAGKINKEAGAVSLAEQEGREDVLEASKALKQWMEDNPGAIPPSELITEISESTTRERLKENRKRTAKIVAIGALVGAVSALASNYMLNHHNGAPTPPPMPKPPTPETFIGVPILDGKPFASAVSSAGLVPKGMAQDLVNFLHQKGLDGGSDITGFKNLRMFHTVDGYSRLSGGARRAIEEFYRIKKIPFPEDFWSRFRVIDTLVDK